MKSNSILILVFLLFTYMGCANITTTSVIAPQEPQIQNTESVSTEIPKLCNPMGRHERGVQLVKEAFISLPSLNSVVSFTPMHVRSLANIAYLFATVESQCNLEKIKGWVSSGLPTVVIIESLVGARHVRVVIGYDDLKQQLITSDPISYRHIRVSYEHFDKSWTDPQRTCLLIHDQYDNGKRLNTRFKRLLHRYRRYSSKDW